MTVVASPLAADCVTVKTAFVVPVSPSVTVTGLIAKVGAVSSFVIVPGPIAVAIVASVGDESVTVKVSSAS